MPTRRKIALALVALAALALAALATVVVTEGGSGSSGLREALALHPVAGGFAPDGTRLEDCTEQTCVEQAFGNIAYHHGPRKAFARLEKEIDPDSNACHRIVHSIGSASLARYGGNVGRTFAEGDSNCFAGYYHGVLERALVNVRSRPGALAAVARTLCVDAQVQAVAELEYQCLHGLGHGLMITTGYDLPVSLEVCDRLGGEWKATSCEGGAFMENISTSYGVRSRWVRDDDPIFPCDAVREGAQRTCYQVVTSRILQVYGIDWERTAKACGSLERRWIRACFQSFGRDVSGQTQRDPEQISAVCEVTRSYGHEVECVRFAAMDMTLNYQRGDEAAILCNQARTALRAPCYHAVGSIMGRFRTRGTERAADCRTLTRVDENVRACIRGASIRLEAVVGE
jgi:hypothetical protein